MRVSRNELTALLSRVFEGQGLIDFDAAAKQVVWLEACGLQGLGRLAGCIDFLEQTGRPQPQLAEVLVGQMAMDFGGNSTLAWGVSATELLYAEALHAGFSTLNIAHCRNRMFILQPLGDCAAFGAHCLAHWRQAGEPSRETLVLFKAGEHYPLVQVWQSTQPVAVRDQHGMTLICSDDAVPLQAYQDEQRSSGATALSQWDADDLAAQYKVSLDLGMELEGDFWETLSRLGERVLVESSDVSRSRGAGPAGD